MLWKKEMTRVGKEYAILILFADGEINDNEEAIDLIVERYKLPISIIIIVITNDPDE